MIEEWRDIQGFEGSYAVSSAGNVLSLARECHHWRGGVRLVRQRLLKPNLQKKKGKAVSSTVNLRHEGKRLAVSVGRLVLLAFIGEPPHETSVAHFKDGNAANALPNNVEWSTFSEIGIEVGYQPPKYYPKIEKVKA